jgi:hypothetical protein
MPVVRWRLGIGPWNGVGFSELLRLPWSMGRTKSSNMVAVRFTVSPLVVVGSTEIAKNPAIGTTAVQGVIVTLGIEVRHWLWNS